MVSSSRSIPGQISAGVYAIRIDVANILVVTCWDQGYVASKSFAKVALEPQC